MKSPQNILAVIYLNRSIYLVQVMHQITKTSEAHSHIILVNLQYKIFKGNH